MRARVASSTASPRAASTVSSAALQGRQLGVRNAVGLRIPGFNIHALEQFEQVLVGEQIRARLEESERQLVGYASNQAIISIPVGPADASGHQQERSLTADSLATLNAELSAATADRIRAESRVNTGRNGAVRYLRDEVEAVVKTEFPGTEVIIHPDPRGLAEPGQELRA